MSLRRVDLRFLLPRPARTAAVLGALDGWESGLRAAGIEPAEAGRQPELTVAPADLAAEAIGTRAEAILLEGRGGSRHLAHAGYAVQRYLALPDLEDPDLVLPLDQGAAAGYALRHWRPAAEPLKRLRNRVVAGLAEHGAVPDRGPVAALGVRERGPPFLVQAAAGLGVPPDAGWFMTRAHGDPLTRAVLHLLAPGAADPAWVLKFARVPGYAEPFDRDERGLRLAHETAPVAGEHVPRLVGRLEVAGIQASVETAAVGESLSTLLRRRRSRAEASRAIEEVAAWIVALGSESEAPPETLAAERSRLASDVLPRWHAAGAPPDLVERLPGLPAVLQHNDLGSWNVVARPRLGFTVLDWESARRHGLPLWDLLYFLVDVLPQVDGARTEEERTGTAIRLLRGESPSSRVLFRWLQRVVEETGLPTDAVGPIATLCWLHHGLSHLARSGKAESVEEGSAAELPPVERIAPAWLADPALGPGWSVWRA